MSINYAVLAATALAATAGLCAPASAQVTFRQLAGYAEVRGGVGQELTGPGNSQIANSYPIGPVAAATSFGNTVGSATFQANAAAGGSLLDASRGTLTFSATASAANRPGDPYAVARAVGNAVYLFNVASLSRLSFDYTASVLGDSPSAYILLTERDASGNPSRVLLNESGYRTPGSLAFDLTAGTYQLRFGNNVNNATSYADNGGADADSINGTLTFAVNALGVPEPASWAMMLVGFGAAGASLRARRRAGVAFA